MNTNFSLVSPAQLDTECLAIVVLDEGEEGKPRPAVQSADVAVLNAAKELTSTDEVTGKIFETVVVHRPQGLKAKRLLLVGGGKAKDFSSYELRKLAGTAIRFLKPKNIRKLAFLAPPLNAGAADAVKAIVEGALAGDFDPDTYKSDRKDQRMDELTVVVPDAAERAPWRRPRSRAKSWENHRTSPANWSTNPLTA